MALGRSKITTVNDKLQQNASRDAVAAKKLYGTGSMRAKVLTIVMLMILGVSGFFVYTICSIKETEIRKKSEEHFQLVLRGFNTTLEKDAKSLMAGLEALTKNEELRSDFMAGDRKQLLEKTESLLDNLRNRYWITNFYFHDAQRRCFLRVHQPDLYGDKINHFTAAQAERTGEITKGIELGPMGTFTLSVVSPWYNGDKLIGYIELREDIEHVIEQLSATQGVKILIVIKKAYFNRTGFEKERPMLESIADWETLKEHVVTDGALKQIHKTLAGIISEDQHKHGLLDKVISIDGEKHRIGFFEFKDAGGHIVGDLVILRDISTDRAALIKTLETVLLVGMVLGVSFFILFYVLLGRIQNQQLQHTVALAEAKVNLQEMNATLEQRVSDRTSELSEANRQLRQTQTELVHSEKMSMLGQLVAGVAHEINTPTGAIMNVTSDSVGHLRELATEAMKVLDLPPDIRQWLTETIPHVLAQETVTCEIDDYDSRREIERELRSQGITEYQRIAEVMSACRMKVSDPLMLRSLTQEPVLGFLEHLTSLKVSSEICHASVRKIIKIVKALRYYSHSTEGEVFDINLNESLDNTLVILQNRIKQVARVERNYQNHLPTVRCGSDISQVWTNIISNACDAIEDSRVEGSGLIQITTSMKSKDLIVEIFNEGSSIPEYLMTKIFDPFVTTKPIGRGTGLGLSICDGILSKYNGRVEARDDTEGVTFRVLLPLVQHDVISTTRSTEKTLEPVAAGVGYEGDKQ